MRRPVWGRPGATVDAIEHSAGRKANLLQLTLMRDRSDVVPWCEGVGPVPSTASSRRRQCTLPHSSARACVQRVTAARLVKTSSGFPDPAGLRVTIRLGGTRKPV
jgi:hypothetical protein